MRWCTGFVVVALSARWAWAIDTGPVSGLVVDVAGEPVRGAMVFAADDRTDTVTAMSVSDDAGKVELVVPRRRHSFGLFSATLGVRELVHRGPASFELVVAPLPADLTGGGGSIEQAARIEAPRAFVVRGRVVDEAGVGLGGIRLEAMRPTGAIVAIGFSGPDGRFAVVAPGGESRLRASAPALKTVRAVYQQRKLMVVMAIAAEPQQLTITVGSVFSFRPGDSIDPEFSPPAPVRARLRYTYGICLPPTPMKAYEKRALKRYWYLDVLRLEPPNPATVSTTTCTTPSAYQPTRLPRTAIGGFDIWNEPIPNSKW